MTRCGSHFNGRKEACSHERHFTSNPCLAGILRKAKSLPAKEVWQANHRDRKGHQDWKGAGDVWRVRPESETPMSGQPTPDSVRTYRTRMKEWTAEAVKLKDLLREKRYLDEKIAKAEDVVKKHDEAIGEMLTQMDLSAIGNTGYKERLAYFLQEVSRQNEEELQSANNRARAVRVEEPKTATLGEGRGV